MPSKKVDLSKITLDPAVVQLIPENLALNHRVVAFEVTESVLKVAMLDDKNLEAIDDLAIATGLFVEAFQADAIEIDTILTRFFNSNQVDVDIDEIVDDEDYLEESISDDSEIARFVTNIIAQAVRSRASDIHIEPLEKKVRVRFRVDGKLVEVMTAPQRAITTIVSRIKILAELDIAERRKPQDGSFRTFVEGKNVDIRVSTLQSEYGEKVVMRLLDSATLISLDELGLFEKDKKTLLKTLEKPHGLIAVVGPTGSGKTTTLYACLKEINSPEMNIVTLEDPIEYILPGLIQTTVNPRAGVTFASGLRAILRQDPDIILVGETRDPETAKIAVQSALTGHLVLTTLHTNDSVGVIPRLNYMGVESYLTSSALTAVLAQRLIRRVCPKCAEEYEPDPRVLEKLELPPGTKLKQGTGCRICQDSGYFGRIGVFELLIVDDHLKHLIAINAPESEIRQYAINKLGLVPLSVSAHELVIKGVTTPEEAFRAISG